MARRTVERLEKTFAIITSVRVRAPGLARRGRRRAAQIRFQKPRERDRLADIEVEVRMRGVRDDSRSEPGPHTIRIAGNTGFEWRSDRDCG
jgi:hypothetical protein